jgi:hypothetical protein
MPYVGVTQLLSTTGSTASGTVTATAGNALFASVAASWTSGAHGPGVVARTGDTWTTHVYQVFTAVSSEDGVFLASAPNCAGGGVTCTVSCSTASSGLQGWVMEYSGPPTSSIVDTTASGTNGTSTTLATASLTNTQATALFVAGVANYDGGNPATLTSTGTGWTAPGIEKNGSLYYPNAIAYKEVTSVAAQQATFSTANFLYATVIGSFKITAGGGGQDTPELYGSPRLSARQMQQLLAQ